MNLNVSLVKENVFVWEINTLIICYFSMFYINPRAHPLRKSLPRQFAGTVLWKTIFFKVCDLRIK